MMKRCMRWIWMVMLWSLLGATDTVEILENPLQPPETGSPRETLFGFIDDFNTAYAYVTEEGRADITPDDRRIVIQRLQMYFDLTDLPEFIYNQASMEVAVSLKEVLDRLELPPVDKVPGDAEVEGMEVWRLPGTHLQIRRMPTGSREGEYLFSEDVVKRIPDIYRQVQHVPYRVDGPETTPGLMNWYRSEPVIPWVATFVNFMPHVVRNLYFGYALWQWIGLVLVFMLGICLMIIAYRVGVKRALKFKEGHMIRYMLTLCFPVTAMLIPLWMKRMIKTDLVLVGDLLRVTDFILGLLVLFATMRLIWAIGNRLLVIVLSHPKIEENKFDTQFLRLIGRILTIISVVVVFLEGGQRLGIPLSTLVAGAGISGLAVALAAQDSLKNILGSVMLILDKPFGVGDRIIFKNYQGFVEEIGLRSTKIKLLTGNVASVPNEVLARLEIENVSKRPSLRKVVQLHVPLDTPYEKTERVLERIRAFMQNHEGMPEEQPPRVFLQELNQVSCMIQVMFWYDPPKTLNMLAFSEKVMFEMLKAAKEEAVELRVPIHLPPVVPQV